MSTKVSLKYESDEVVGGSFNRVPFRKKRAVRVKHGKKRSERPSDDAGARIEETWRLSIEEAFAEAEASLRMKGMDPSGPFYDAIKARVIAGEIGVEEAVAELRNGWRRQDAIRHLIELGGTMPGLKRIPRRMFR
jgi:hypothetical protein